MPTLDGLPEDFTEYLEVWCADLLAPLGPLQRERLIDRIELMYTGGPWPDRWQIQRQVEVTRGILTADAAIGLILVRDSGGLAGAIERLAGPLHDAAVRQLSQMPGTVELVAAVGTARRRGLISDAERDHILAAAVAQPIAPEPRPLPAHLRPLPPGYPEHRSAGDARADLFRPPTPRED